MEKLKHYCLKKGYEFVRNNGGGITIFAPYEKHEQIVRYIKKLQGISYNPLESWCNHNYTFKMLPVYTVI